MGGAVSSGRDNNELVDNLMSGNYIRTSCVERVFRALDRADYMTPESRDQAYKDLAWRNGALHLSSPCIYSEVMEGLELKPGLSFLNIGSGTGYLSTLAGLILGSGGISHGVEVHSSVVDYANKNLSLFIANSPTLDEFDFCEPKFYVGNGLCLMPQQKPYDRVYCGAGCPNEYLQYFKQLVKVGGVLVIPYNDTLLQMRRVKAKQWTSHSLLNVSFAALRVPRKEDRNNYLNLDEQTPPRLQVVARSAVRAGMRRGVLRRHPELREPAAVPPSPAANPRRIYIPIDPGDAIGGLNILHDLSTHSASEMNALLSLVVSMDQNEEGDVSHSDESSDDGGAPRPGGEDNDRRPRSVTTAAKRLDADGSDTGHTSSKSSTTNPPDSDSTSSDTRSPKSQSTSDRSDSRGGSKYRHPDKSDRTSSDDSTNSKIRGQIDLDDILSYRSDTFRRTRHSGRMWSFEFKAPERASEPSASTRVDLGFGSSTTSTAPDEGDGSKSDTKASKSRRGSSDIMDKDLMITSEVELCFQDSKLVGVRPGPSGVSMAWQEKEPIDDEQTEETANSKAKRQKLDSGIGENTPNTPSGSSPDKSKTEDSETDERPSDSLTDEVAQSHDSTGGNRRRVHKRTRCDARASSSSAEEGAASAGRAAGVNPRRRAPRQGQGYDARRVRLSIVMKRAIKELPLPYALKKYVNFGRCFEF